MAITLTDAAVKQVRTHLARRGRGLGLRLGVRKSGCSGFAYVVDFADEVNEDDEIFEDHGIKIVVRRDFLNFLDGTRLDFRREGFNEIFHFENPNVKDECGCGESFSV